ncbi:hypothetical protein [Brevundimonas sp.]|uniref:hypothetical protein n=1 Tax=Brevundimonas sp. TaxID=1871086 RepID=UPI002FC69B5E
MKIAAITLCLMLAGCARTVYVEVPAEPVELPALPPILSAEAVALPPLVSHDLHGHMREGVQSDRQYNDLRHRYDWLVKAYECLRLRQTGCLNDPAGSSQ